MVSKNDRIEINGRKYKTSNLTDVAKNLLENLARMGALSSEKSNMIAILTKAKKAALEINAKGLCIGGGVAANSRLREAILDTCLEEGLQSFVPSRSYCTDNAAMVAAAAWRRYCKDGASSLFTGADPNLRLPE